MEIKVSQEQARVPVTVLQVSGEVDSSNYESFQKTASDAIAAGARYILLDLTHVTYTSSAGLRAIHEIFKTLRAKTPDTSEEEVHKGISAGTYISPHLKLLNPSEGVSKVLKVAGFDMYLSSYTDRNKALASF